MSCVSTEEAANFLEENYQYISKSDETTIIKALSNIGVMRKPATFEEFDMLDEVQEQMQMVRDLRKTIMASDSNTRDVKDLITSSTQLFTMLTKMKSEINNQDKLSKIEEATVTVVKSLPLEAQGLFFDTLEELLS